MKELGRTQEGHQRWEQPGQRHEGSRQEEGNGEMKGQGEGSKGKGGGVMRDAKGSEAEERPAGGLTGLSGLPLWQERCLKFGGCL